MVDRTSRPIVPTEHADEREHRRLLAVRASASLPKDGTEGMTAPLKLMSYATADLPTASLYPGAVVFVTDGPAFAYSDGATWTQLVGAVTPEVPAIVVVNTGTFSAASSVDIDIQPYTAFDQIKLVVSNVTQSVANEYFCRVQFSFDGGATFKQANGDYYYAGQYGYSADAGDTVVGNDDQNSAAFYSAWIRDDTAYIGNHEMTLFNPYSTTAYKLSDARSSAIGDSSYYAMYWKHTGICWYTDPIDKIKIFPNSGTFDGRWTLYGIRTQ